MRVFGSPAFLKAQEKKRSGYQRKLGPRAVKLIFVGYDDFTYRLFESETRKIIVGREVVFDEASIPVQAVQSTNYDELDNILAALPSDPKPTNEREISVANAVEANMASDEPKTMKTP